VSALKILIYLNNVKAKYQMKEFLAHVKKIVIADIKLFWEPYFIVGRFIRRFFIAMVTRIKRWRIKSKNGGDQ
jgi:hypothetical protein